MKNLISLSDYTLDEINEIYKIAEELEQGKHSGELAGKTAVMFFPSTSIRTRVTYEKGIYLLSGQSILFPTETLDKKEDLQDVVGYLNNWADLLIVRHSEIGVIETIAKYAKAPVINAMTAINHPCEILSDLYALSKIKGDITKYKFLFCGGDGNIGRAWKEAAKAVGFELEQCCPAGYEIEGLTVYHDIENAILGKDIVCTDSLPAAALDDFKRCRVTKEIMGKANKGAILNPCPPFYRGEEVSQDVINSEYFAGYEFKKCLLYVQQAIMLYCLS